MHHMANLLQHEHSPYLRQHRDNPVHWQAWGPEALDQAKSENKLLIVSIGYSTCHWCHVMERETFEDQEVAQVMNNHYISIKVDREERPDIDQVYMKAVQLMTQSGGWPLNCICLPDGRPIYGGTYFRREEWMSLLMQLQQLWEEQPQTAYEYAEKLAAGIQQSERLPIQKQPATFRPEQLEAIVQPWKDRFDEKHGGLLGSPKFPMPNNWLFLLQYGWIHADEEVLKQVHFTLKKMASGGIYDQVGGGFARYSVDEHWQVPHFEKMLYDNAQLVTLYLAAWQHQKDPSYRRVVLETLEWIEREMTSPEGGFYCGLDADSEGIEGRFYTFTEADLQSLTEHGLTEEEVTIMRAYYRCSEEGNWPEERTNVLHHAHDADMMAAQWGYDAEEWEKFLTQLKAKLLAYRSQRIRPGLDDKILTSWNALMIKAYCEAHQVFNDEKYMKIAIRNAQFIRRHMYTDQGGLLHQPADSNRAIPGYLEDYACLADAYMRLYESTFDESWLHEAKRLTDYCITHFLDPEEGIFYFTDDQVPTIITRQTEIMDDVIPSSNSILLGVMQKLGVIFEEPQYVELVRGALARLLSQMTAYGTAFSNWAILLLREVSGYREIIISGSNPEKYTKTVHSHFIPDKLLFGGTESEIPILQGRLSEKDRAYLCQNRTCSLPVESAERLSQLLGI